MEITQILPAWQLAIVLILMLIVSVIMLYAKCTGKKKLYWICMVIGAIIIFTMFMPMINEVDDVKDNAQSDIMSNNDDFDNE